MAEEYLLEMRGVSKSFPGVQALKNVRLAVKAGEVHALMGENGAGKSTLMKCLFGIYHMDEGEILFQGKPVRFENPNQALRNGIAMVQQELEQVPARSVMDNIWLGRYPRKGALVDDRKMYKDTEVIIEDFGVDIDPCAQISALSVSTKQMVDIIKAVSYDAKVIVLDEPTSSLTEKETVKLFEIIRRLKADGCAIIYISHKMDEVMKISDSVTIMRDGTWIGTEETKGLSVGALIKMMVNRDLNARFPAKTNQIGKVNLEVKNLSTVYSPKITNITLEVREGEIFGIGGLVGAGRTEFLESIFGLRKVESGTVVFNGKKLTLGMGPKEIGMALLTEERRVTGNFPLLDLRWNAVASSMKDNKGKFGFISMEKVEKNTKWVIDSMKVKTPSTKALISNLSGGNQQKVLLGRCLLNDPEVLLLDEPTRGIDVGAKYEIYQLMIDLAQRGKTIIFVSSEMPELLGMADRIMVMSNGRNAGIVDVASTSQEEILHLATKYL